MSGLQVIIGLNNDCIKGIELALTINAFTEIINSFAPKTPHPLYRLSNIEKTARYLATSSNAR